MTLYLLQFIYSRPKRMSIYGRLKMIGEEGQDNPYVEHCPRRTHWCWDLLVCVFYVCRCLSTTRSVQPFFHYYSCNAVRVIGVWQAHGGRVRTPLGLPTHKPRDRWSCLWFQTDYTYFKTRTSFYSTTANYISPTGKGCSGSWNAYRIMRYDLQS
jgi:hypothetical protein